LWAWSLEFEDAPSPPTLLGQVRSSSLLTAPKVPARFLTLETFTPFSLHRARRIPGFRTTISRRIELFVHETLPYENCVTSWSRRQRKRLTATPQASHRGGMREDVLTSHSAQQRRFRSPLAKTVFVFLTFDTFLDRIFFSGFHHVHYFPLNIIRYVYRLHWKEKYFYFIVGLHRKKTKYVYNICYNITVEKLLSYISLEPFNRLQRPSFYYHLSAKWTWIPFFLYLSNFHLVECI